VSVPVNITGVQGTLKAMRKFDPDLNKQMNKQIKNAMLPIRDKARGYAPANSQMLSNWTKADAFGPQTRKYRAFPKYDQSETQKGIIYKQSANKVNRNGFQAVYFIANNSAGGAIYETAGRKSGLGGRPTTHQARVKGGGSFTQSGTRRDNNSLNPNAGRQLMEVMGPLVGNYDQSSSSRTANTGRLIFRAWAEDQGRVTHGVQLAINTAVATFNATNTGSAFGLAA
jgi:hypothetical protein